jgi:hypothetical protein
MPRKTLFPFLIFVLILAGIVAMYQEPLKNFMQGITHSPSNNIQPIESLPQTNVQQMPITLSQPRLQDQIKKMFGKLQFEERYELLIELQKIHHDHSRNVPPTNLEAQPEQRSLSPQNRERNNSLVKWSILNSLPGRRKDEWVAFSGFVRTLYLAVLRLVCDADRE